MPAPAYNNSIATANGTGQTINVTLVGASERPAGSLMIVNIHVASQNPVFEIDDLPAGWSPLLPDAGYNSGGDHKAWLFKKIANGTETSPVPFYMSGTGSATTNRAAHMTSILGAHQTAPVHVAGTFITVGGGGTTITAPGITTTRPECLLLGFAYTNYLGGTTGNSWTSPAGMSEQYDSNGGTTLGGRTLAFQTLAAAGATGDKTWTHGQTSGKGAVLVAIQPPGGGNPMRMVV